MELTTQDSNRLRIEFQTEPIGVLEALNSALSVSAQIELDNVLPGATDGQWLEFFTITAPEVSNLVPILDEIGRIEPVFVQPASSISNTFYVLTFINGHEPRPTAILLAHDAVPHRIIVQDQDMTIVASVTSWQKLKTLAEAIERQHRSFELVGVTETNEMSFPLGGSILKYNLQGKLTPEQLTIIETAYQCGYFEVPQQATAEDVAQELDICQSTLSEQLRNAQNAVWNVLFGDRIR
ncbi:helix-turn-helix domain-containing protein [Natronorubrum tibetense]|uniref:Bacterio-opsin activator n=1 Tax=Natronorubrum tibetense GA33 TaxID=1114856 RepID=L9VL63_9EURY|nr:helix-turn-helix domain-containing protein [Natronorubrum tibetense]ELY37702.1 bacterio-opsin activator [Natronorubrum tibetense GA33]